MRKQLADQWALQVLEQIASGGAFETGLVELKREANDFDRLARQLAGAANAAQMDPLLLLVGVDQNEGVVGTDVFEVGDWYAQIRSRFEYGEAPHLAYPNFIRFNDRTVGVFVFETDNTPYVIGQGKKGSPREVLWRYGSNTAPAGRSELLRLLLRRAANPELEIQRAEIRVGHENHVTVVIELFLYPSQSFPELVIPFHRISIEAADDTGAATTFTKAVSIAPRNPHASLAKLTDSAVVVPSPSKLKVDAAADSFRLSLKAPLVHLGLRILPAHFDSTVFTRITVSRRDHPDHRGYWELPSDHAKRLDTFEDQLKVLEAIAPKKFESPFPPLPRPW